MICKGHSSLIPVYLHSHKMNFGALNVWNSYPQAEVSCNVKWRSLNYAFRYGASLAISVYCNLQGHSSLTIYTFMNFDKLRAKISSPQLEVSSNVEWRSPNFAFNYTEFEWLISGFLSILSPSKMSCSPKILMLALLLLELFFIKHFLYFFRSHCVNTIFTEHF